MKLKMILPVIILLCITFVLASSTLLPNPLYKESTALGYCYQNVSGNYWTAEYQWLINGGVSVSGNTTSLASTLNQSKNFTANSTGTSVFVLDWISKSQSSAWVEIAGYDQYYEQVEFEIQGLNGTFNYSRFHSQADPYNGDPWLLIEQYNYSSTSYVVIKSETGEECVIESATPIYNSDFVQSNISKFRITYNVSGDTHTGFHPGPREMCDGYYTRNHGNILINFHFNGQLFDESQYLVNSTKLSTSTGDNVTFQCRETGVGSWDNDSRIVTNTVPLTNNCDVKEDGSRLLGVTNGSDVDQDNLHYYYEWLFDGVSNSSGQISAEHTTYQENANATAWVSWTPDANVLDGDWNTGAAWPGWGGDKALYLNYTKPSDATGAMWTERSGTYNVQTDLYRNLTIPDACFYNGKSELELRFFMPQNLEFECKDSTGSWIYLASLSGAWGLYEEAVTWTIGTENPEYADGNWTFKCLATDDEVNASDAWQQSSYILDPCNMFDGSVESGSYLLGGNNCNITQDQYFEDDVLLDCEAGKLTLNGYGLDTNESDNVTIQNCDLDPGYIYITGNNTLLRNNTFDQVYIEATEAVNVTILENVWIDTQPGDFSIQFVDSVNAVVENNTFVNVTPAITVNLIQCDGTDMYFKGNNLTDVDLGNDTYIMQLNCPGSKIENNDIVRLQLGGYGNMFTLGGDNIEFINNRIIDSYTLDGSWSGGIFSNYNVSNINYTDNVISNFTRYNAVANEWAACFSLGHANNIRIVGNNLTDTNCRVLGAGGPDNILIEGNRFVNAGWGNAGLIGHGDSADPPQNYTFINNYVEDVFGITMSAAAGTPLRNILFENNQFVNPKNNTGFSSMTYYENLTWNNNTFNMTHNCIDDGVLSDWCYWGGISGNTVTNNRYSADYNDTWGISISENCYDVNGTKNFLVEDNDGQFYPSFRLRYGCDMYGEIKDNNFTRTNFPDHAEYAYGAADAIGYFYEFTGETHAEFHLNFTGNNYDMPTGGLFYLRFTSDGDDDVRFEGNTFTNTPIDYVYRYSWSENGISFQNNDFGNPYVIIAPLSSDINVSSNELLNESGSINLNWNGFYWEQYTDDSIFDVGGLSINNLSLNTTSNTEIRNFHLSAPGTDIGTNNTYTDYTLEYANITEFSDYDNTTLLVVNVPNLASVDLTLEGQHGLIRWNSPIDINSFGDFDRIVDISYNTITVNPETNDVNGSANLTFYTTGYKALTKFGLKRNGLVIDKATAVNNLLVNVGSGDISFEAPHFTTYTLYGLTTSFGGSAPSSPDLPLEEEEEIEILPLLGVVPTPSTLAPTTFVEDIKLFFTDTFSKAWGLIWNPNAHIESWMFNELIGGLF